MGEEKLRQILKEEILESKMITMGKVKEIGPNLNGRLDNGNIVIDEVEVLYKINEQVTLEIRLHNKTDIKVREVIQVYIKDLNSIYATFMPTLCTFKTIELEAREQRMIEMKICPEAFTIIDEKGDCYRDSNNFEIYISTTGIDSKSETITETNPIIKKIEFKSIIGEI